MAKYPKPIITCKIKIHNPSNYKKQALLKTMQEIAIFYKYLCDKFRDKQAELESITKEIEEKIIEVDGKQEKSIKISYNDKALTNYISKIISKENHEINTISRYSAIYHFVENVLAWMALKDGNDQEDPGFPDIVISDDKDQNYINNLFEKCLKTGDLEAENELKALMRKKNKITLLPIYYKRYAQCRLLRTDDGTKMYALLDVAETKKTVEIPNNWIDVKLNKEVSNIYNKVKDKKTQNITLRRVIPQKMTTKLLLPLEIDRRQFLNYFRKGYLKICTLAYNEHKDEFYLHCVFLFKPKRIKYKTILGIDRGIINLAAFAVIDLDNNVLNSGYSIGQELMDKLKEIHIEIKSLQEKDRRDKKIKRLYKKRDAIIKNNLYKIANNIINIARSYDSVIVLEDLKKLSEKGKKKNRKYAQYNRLGEMIKYKARLAGIRVFPDIGAYYTSTTCLECGKVDKSLRNGLVFKCDCNDKEHNSDIHGAMTIAVKANWMFIEKGKKGDYKSFQEYIIKRVAKGTKHENGALNEQENGEISIRENGYKVTQTFLSFKPISTGQKGDASFR